MLLLLAVVLVLTISRETDSHKCNGGDSCCSWINICDNGEGDCDLDSQCRGRLKCGDNNCAGLTFDTTDDCCWDAGVVFQALSLIYFWGIHLNVWWSLKGCNGNDDGCCTTTEPCREGFGDCDSDAQCAGDLRCGRDNCDRFELHKNGVSSLYFPVLSCILRYIACKSIAGWTIATGLNLFDKKLPTSK